VVTLDAPLLVVKDLKTYFYLSKGVLKAVDGVNLTINKNQVFCLVGETGCGKSVTALSITRLIFYPGKIVGGSIIYEGKDLLKLPENEMRKIRGKEIAMIFQSPMKSLNPVFNIGYQISEAPIVHFNLKHGEAWKQAIELIGKVKMPDPEMRAKSYPHVLSGGMRQRSMIAMMISCEPKLLIADEPTTALDVTVQAQIMDLLLDIKRRSSMSIMLITHNFGLVAERGDEVAVMYSGKVVERGSVKDVFNEPLHPYTQGLLRCIPVGFERKTEIDYIPGTLPSPINPPVGCRFHPRCKYATEKCIKEEPKLMEIGKNHIVACHLCGG
jgi:peptide/nickel transport system ATP-binding protein